MLPKRKINKVLTKYIGVYFKLSSGSNKKTYIIKESNKEGFLLVCAIESDGSISLGADWYSSQIKSCFDRGVWIQCSQPQ